ncbi:hypothetical protein A6R68_21742 [Neotoma lepida]|uniref:Uncharacterized protein n=1 Tax=Neotoma lepida TaxID=56216 RepID=A0A1A6HP79_NEOLE|nr:hypothetical protein A6R68_21742 [Neotoma lepida]
MKAWYTEDYDNDSDEWEQEIGLTEQAVEAKKKLNPKPKIFVYYGDLTHSMATSPTPWQELPGRKNRPRTCNTNAGGTYRDLDMVFSSATGCQLGKDTHRLHVVVVTAENIVHHYYSLDELSKRGIDHNLKELMKE